MNRGFWHRKRRLIFRHSKRNVQNINRRSYGRGDWIRVVRSRAASRGPLRGAWNYDRSAPVHRVALAGSHQSHTQRKSGPGSFEPGPDFGRGDWIRTSGLYVPNVALYQAEPHLVKFRAPKTAWGHGCGRRIRTLTNRVRVCRATFTQFRKILFGTARFIIPNRPGLSIPFAEKLQKEAGFPARPAGKRAGSGTGGTSHLTDRGELYKIKSDERRNPPGDSSAAKACPNAGGAFFTALSIRTTGGLNEGKK